MKKNLMVLSIFSLLLLTSCGGFQAKRVDSNTGDQEALGITDEWVDGDTVRAIKDVVSKMENHKSFKRYLRKLGRPPKVFVGDVQNATSNAYFPIDDLNDEFLDKLSESGDFILVDASSREKILKEITYQNDGMVDPAQAKMIGKQAGADLMIFGRIHMKPKSRGGKTIKQYSINLRMTDIEKAVEVLRVRTKIEKYSERSKW